MYTHLHTYINTLNLDQQPLATAIIKPDPCTFNHSLPARTENLHSHEGNTYHSGVN